MTDAKTRRFNLIERTSNKFGERNDCTVKAVAMACRVSYTEAHVACESLGRRRHKGMQNMHVLFVAKKLGFTLTPVKLKRKNGSKFTQRTVGVKCKNGYYMAFVRGHVLPVINGEVYDWSKGRCFHVREVWKITRTN